MDEIKQGNNNDAPPTMPVKRKRGRPRKDPSLIRRTNAPAPPPGFRIVNGNQPRQLLAIENAHPNANANPVDNIVGQAVTGVVEGTFDAGYLLAVKIGNSTTSLRGVVFKPGHFVPISSENDVAPHVQTIRRNEIPLPLANQNRVRGRRPKSRERNKQHGNIQRMETSHFLNGYPTANQVQIFAPQTTDLASSKGKQVVPVSAYSVPSVGSRGLVVPVVLQPVSLSNGFPPSYQMPPFPSQTSHTVVLNHKPLQTVATQVESSQSQSSHQVTPEGGQNGAFRDLQSSGTHIDNSMGAGKSSAEDSGLSGEGDSDTSEPLSVEPLQTIHSHIRYQSGPVHNPAELNKIGRMSELLQEQMPPVENKATGNDVTDKGTAPELCQSNAVKVGTENFVRLKLIKRNEDPLLFRNLRWKKS
ncbi:hypothetical protein RHSIM_RhsimUnG0251000 [Rhododendron simsii]|uniref:AT hook motif-containing protein n=1 Tax=Rhododendron simsii TaxID=118357 RepID=A0A834L3Q0_RHOSS|nr:hypothetical protein RHSIM_RhsimUnG0251000 [Rhododendron simsii]